MKRFCPYLWLMPAICVALLLLLVGYRKSPKEKGNFPPKNTQVALDSTNLPIVFLNVDGRRIMRSRRLKARMTVINNGEGKMSYADTLTHPNQNADYCGTVAIRYRGQSSYRMAPKKPYSIKLKNARGKKIKQSLMGMNADNDWALMSAYSDLSLMRDLLAFELARPYMPFVPQGRFCELVVDGIYYGVYIMMERNSAGVHRLAITSPEKRAEALTGDYYVEIDRKDEHSIISKRPALSSSGEANDSAWIYYNLKIPKYDDLSDEQRNYVAKAIERMEDALATTSYDNALGYRKWVNVLSLIDYQIASELCHNVDAYRLSMGLVKRRDSEDPRFFATLWDMNLGYGNCNRFGADRTDTWMWQNNDVLMAAGDENYVPFWWHRLMADPGYVSALKARWRQCRQEAYSTRNIHALIDSMATVLSAHGAQQRNFKAWPSWNRYINPIPYIASGYDDEIRYMKDWIDRRLAFMDKELLGAALDP